MEYSKQATENAKSEFVPERDSSVSDAKWMLVFVVILAAAVFGLGMVAEAYVATPDL